MASVVRAVGIYLLVLKSWLRLPGRLAHLTTRLAIPACLTMSDFRAVLTRSSTADHSGHGLAQ
jgi:hypothetical protein